MKLRYWLALFTLLLSATFAGVIWQFKSPITVRLLNHYLNEDDIQVSCLNWNINNKKLSISELCLSTPQATIQLNATTLTFNKTLFDVATDYQALLDDPKQWPKMQGQFVSVRLKQPISAFTQQPHGEEKKAIEHSERIAIIHSFWQKLPQISFKQIDVELFEYSNKPLTLTVEANSQLLDIALHKHSLLDATKVLATRNNEQIALRTELSAKAAKQFTQFASPLGIFPKSAYLEMLELIKQGQLSIALTSNPEALTGEIEIKDLHTHFDAQHTKQLNLSQDVQALAQHWFNFDPHGSASFELNTKFAFTHHFDSEISEVHFADDSHITASLSDSTKEKLVQTLLSAVPREAHPALPQQQLLSHNWYLGFPEKITFHRGKPTSTIDNLLLKSTTQDQLTLLSIQASLDFNKGLSVTGDAELSVPINSANTTGYKTAATSFDCKTPFSLFADTVSLTPVCNTQIPAIALTTPEAQKSQLNNLAIQMSTTAPIVISNQAISTSPSLLVSMKSNVKTRAINSEMQLSLASRLSFKTPSLHVPLDTLLEQRIQSENLLTVDDLPELKVTTEGTFQSQAFELASWKPEIYQLLPYGEALTPSSLIIRAGSINLVAQGEWTPKHLKAQITFESSGVTGEFDGILFAEAAHTSSLSTNNGTISFSPLVFDVGIVDSGILTSNIHGQIDISQKAVNDRFSLILQDMKGDVLGGQFSVSSGAIYPELAKEWNIKLDELSLAELVPPSDEFKVTVTGKVSGDIPVELLDSGPIVKQGRLRNISNGEIRVQQNATIQAISGGNEQVSRGMNYLSNLQFTELRCEVTMTEDATVLLKNHVVGRNPDLDQAIELNYNHEQNFFMWLKLLRAGERIIDSFTNQ